MLFASPPRLCLSARAALFGSLAASLVVGLLGCGPSLRLVAASNDYFEYCYAADRDDRRTDEERRACWTAWQAYYQTGQAPDRLDYVRERLVMLDPARASAIELATGESPETTAVEPAIVVVGTDTTQPEGGELMSVIGERPAPTARERRSPVIPRSRSSACADVCSPDFRACALACRLSDRGCMDACRHRFRQCSHGCF